MKNKRKMALVSLILAIISLVDLVFVADTIVQEEIIVLVCFVLAIVGAILGYISRKDGKGLAIAGMIIGIVSLVLTLLTLLGLTVYAKVGDCVDNGDKTATCKYNGQEVVVPINYLTDEQLVKWGNIWRIKRNPIKYCIRL